MTKESPKIHSTRLILRRKADFKRFFEGVCEYLKENMVKQKIGGSYEYYTCGREHCSLDPKWEPFKHLRTYCWKAKFDFYHLISFSGHDHRGSSHFNMYSICSLVSSV